TTRAFWQETLPTEPGRDPATSLVGQVVGSAGPRLEIIPMNPGGLDLGKFHTYELAINGVHLSVVWDGDNGRFITCDNLDYLARPEQLGQPVGEVLNEAREQRRALTLEEPVGYGGRNKVWGTIVVEEVRSLPEAYPPAIPILAEPRTFMALVPANRALEVVKAIKAKYETEMGKVRNRLPLTLGVVYAGRRTPLAALLDTGRRMLRRPPQEMQAEVTALEPPTVTDVTWPQERKVSLRLDERQITVTVPAVMGDGKTPDVWYPYWRVAGKPTDRTRWFVGPDGEHWVHVCDLRPGDTVAFTLSTFDYEYLDTTARRFEVTYDAGGRRKGKDKRHRRGIPATASRRRQRADGRRKGKDKRHRRGIPATASRRRQRADGRRKGKDKRHRPYLLEEVDAIEQAWSEIRRLSTSQIHQVAELIEAKRRDWDEPAGTLGVSPIFRQFVGDVLREAKVHTDFLEQAAITGRLADVLEIHLTIHKEKP
ncbi:MAG: hypothetical protein ACP5NB_13535, partial [Chloroflexia bacterium]